jgi:hypothetical protein
VNQDLTSLNDCHQMTPKTVERALFILQTFVSTLPMQCASAVLRLVMRSAATICEKHSPEEVEDRGF